VSEKNIDSDEELMHGLFIAILVATTAFVAWHLFSKVKKSRGERKVVTPFPAFQTTSQNFPTTPTPPATFATKKPLSENDLRGGNAGYDDDDLVWQGGWLGLDLP
jgi:hypothetical protein